MGKWADRYESNFSDFPENGTTKTPKRSFKGGTQKNSLPNFCRLVQHFGADSGVMLEESAILSELDSEGIEELRTASTEVKQSWAASIAIRLVQAGGIVPKGWDRVAHCQHCGPVHSFHNLDTLSCGWCDMRLAGKWFPTPNQQEINNGIPRSRKPVSDDDTG